MPRALALNTDEMESMSHQEGDTSPVTSVVSQLTLVEDATGAEELLSESEAYLREQRALALAVLQNPDYYAPKQASAASPFLPDAPHTSFLNHDHYPERRDETEFWSV